MRFVDQRMFGGLLVSTGGAELPSEIAHIARDPLDPEFDDAAFVARVRRRTSGIKRQLLDQTLISGVGNIYADEALWRAKVHGDRPGTRLTRPQVSVVLGQSREVMAAALGRRAGRPSTRSTSTSTASPATSTGRCTPTAARGCPATAAAPRSGGSRS